MILNHAQSAAVDSLLRHVGVAATSADQQLTLLAVALVLSCQNVGVEKEAALEVIGGLFDDAPQTLMLMHPPSASLH